MKKPIIGIVGSPYEDKDGDFAIQIPQKLVNAIVNLGGNVLGIMPTQGCDYSKPGVEIPQVTDMNLDDIIDQLKQCDAVIQPGGKRIYLYQKYIYGYTLLNDVPFLGICAGMQTMANYDSKQANIKDVIKSDIDHTKPHIISIMPNSLLYDIVGKIEIIMDSRHTKCIDTPSTIFKVSAYASDGTIEAIEVPNKKFHIGVQSHPENIFSKEEQAIFERLTDTSKPKVYYLDKK